MARSRTARDDAGPPKAGDLSFEELMRRSSWAPLPELVILAGEATFLRKQIERRFIRELFGEQPLPALARFDGAQETPDLLATVLDELRTVSLLSSERLVIVDAAESFLAEHREALEPFVESGFAGGRLILHVEKLDTRTRLARAILEKGWVVRCKQPFDRPPPWQTGGPPWDNELTRWIVAWARGKGLDLDPQTAFELQERAGSDLGAIDESLEKLRTFLGPSARRVDRRAIAALAGDTREDSVFDLVDAFIARDRARALAIAERLFRHGYQPGKGPAVLEPTAIAILFIGALVNRIKALRRAHAIAAAGLGADEWMRLGLTSRPFIERFRRQLREMPPNRIERVFEALHGLDRGVKSGMDAVGGVAVVLGRE
jgi:DNA polymerase III delta subunit